VRALLRELEYLLRDMKGASGDLGTLAARLLQTIWRTLKTAALPEVLASFAVSIVLTIVSIGAVLATHLALTYVWRRRANVFISFQHEREGAASAIATAMERAGLHAKKLPFVENPDHDALLDEVRTAIRNCDVCVCIPGSRPSFVENEVAMAFQIYKPLLFVLAEPDRPSLPNTAKKGYPLFSLAALQAETFRTLATFCSYLAADWRSTVRLYGSVFRHIGSCLMLSIAIYIGLISILTSCAEPSSPAGSARLPLSVGMRVQSALSDFNVVWFVAGSLLLFLLPYAYFTLTRWHYRRTLGQMISRRKFSEEYLPETLDYLLGRKDLVSILVLGDVAAHHESQEPHHESQTRPSRGA
jgi:hypothetical protein